jgi:S1-C subfamily serine protease
MLPGLISLCAVMALRAAEGDRQPADLVRDYSGSLIFVEEKGGAGSGFICNIAGRKFALTNQHVVASQNAVAFTLLDGTTLKVGQAAAAVGHDIMSFALLSDTKAMEMMIDVEKNAAIGDEVVVLGNPEGARVIRPLTGKLVGIGPNLVEVDAAFVPGNSGSPILHLKSGKVIGVATYLIVREMDALSGRSAPQVRRFGFRLDSVKQWQPVAWPVYRAEFRTIQAIEARTQDLASLLQELGRTGGIVTARHQNPAIRAPLEQFEIGLFT